MAIVKLTMAFIRRTDFWRILPFIDPLFNFV